VYDGQIEFVTIIDIPHNSIVYYLNAADVLLMTLKYEGSPNIIKEAMACNCPIVSTDVGDVNWVMGETESCFITSFDPNDIVDKMKTALKFGNRTKGRDRLIDLGLDSDTIAKKIVTLYTSVLTKNGR